MSLLWLIVGVLVLIVWVLSIIDIFRRHYPVGTTVGYLLLIVILPFIGTLIYWTVRKPTAEEQEREYLAESDLRRSAGSRPFDGTGLGP